MKKKIIITFTICLFAAGSIFNMNLAQNDQYMDISLADISIMAQRVMKLRTIIIINRHGQRPKLNGVSLKTVALMENIKIAPLTRPQPTLLVYLVGMKHAFLVVLLVNGGIVEIAYHGRFYIKYSLLLYLIFIVLSLRNVQVYYISSYQKL